MGLFRKKKQSSEAEQDLVILRMLEEHGADLSKPRDVQHFIYATDADALKGVAPQLESAGWNVTVEAAEESDAYVLTASADSVVNEDVVVHSRALFESAAAEANGLYDGWVASAE